MAALPYIQLYVADYLADTAHISTLENGAYLLLIFNYWQRGESFKAKDEHSLNRRLASVARMSSEEWETVKDSLSEFFEISETEWRHARIDRDLGAVNSKSEKAKAAGKASAASKANARSTSVEQTFNHTDTDTDTDTDINTKSKDRLPPVATTAPKTTSSKGTRLSPDWVLPKAWGEWALSERSELCADDVRREADNFRDHWLSQAASKGVKADWLATWRKWIRSDLVKATGAGGVNSAHWFMSSSGIEAKGAELVIEKQPGEIFPAYRARVYRAAGVTDEMIRKAKIDAGERV